MEKFSEADLMREIKSCTYDQDYETAVKLSEKLDLNKIKNVSSLCLLGEIFIHEDEKDLAEKVLLKAYEKMPKGRRALDLLTGLYIDKQSYSEAEYYYKEFISVASRDLHRYILRYRLDKGKGERTSVLIHTLEQLKDYEYIEEWAYELAKLYFEAGEYKKCVRECDEIAVWFGQGEFVDLASALKQEVEDQIAADAAAQMQQKTVGATYMFDSEGLLERSDFNVKLNVDEYMEDDEYSDVYNLDEGGHTETKIMDFDTLDQTESEPEIGEAEVIAAKTDEILSGSDVDKFEEESASEEDFITRLQRNISGEEAPIQEEEEDDDEDEADDEIINDAMQLDAFNLFEEKAEAQPMRTEDEDEIFSEDIPVPDTVMDIFATAVDIKNVKKQLAETFTKLESSLLDKEDILAPYDINFVVSGTDESMKSQIAIGIAKALNTYGMCDKNKMVRATADELNRMDFSMVFDKIAGGCLIIRGAGKLSETSVQIIDEYVHANQQKVAIILEDSETDLLELWTKYPKLRSKFLNVINISKYDESELVKLAESYAKRRGYDVSEEARQHTLKDIFSQRMSDGEDVNYEDIMAVIDAAVINLEKRNMKNLFMTVLDNAYKEASMFTLLPEDFI